MHRHKAWVRVAFVCTICVVVIVVVVLVCDCWFLVLADGVGDGVGCADGWCACLSLLGTWYKIKIFIRGPMHLKILLLISNKLWIPGNRSCWGSSCPYYDTKLINNIQCSYARWDEMDDQWSRCIRISHTQNKPSATAYPIHRGGTQSFMLMGMLIYKPVTGLRARATGPLSDLPLSTSNCFRNVEPTTTTAISKMRQYHDDMALARMMRFTDVGDLWWCESRVKCAWVSVSWCVKCACHVIPVGSYCRIVQSPLETTKILPAGSTVTSDGYDKVS